MHEMTQKTYREAYQWASSLLTAQQTKSPAFEAELLLRNSAGIERYQLFMLWDAVLNEKAWEHYQASIARRQHHEPIQYITQEQEFYGRPFYVDKRVLIPRPETEGLVEQALKKIVDLQDSKVSILDIGTGSGAISVSIALELDEYYTKRQPSETAQKPEITIYGLDISADALEVAKLNQQRLVSRKSQYEVALQWHLGDTWPIEQPSEQPNGEQPQYQIILSNPPYVEWSEQAIMDREVKEYEPEIALFANEQGLSMYKKIISEANHYLVEGGWLGFEIGYKQADAIQQLFRMHDFHNIEIYQDLAGHQRIVFAQRLAGALVSK